MANIVETYLTDIKHQKDFINDGSGDLETISGIDNVKQAIYRRIMTVKGTVIHRPNYGVGLPAYQNAISSLATQRKIAIEIQEQLEEDERIDEVTSVSFVAMDSTPDKYELKIKVNLMAYGEKEMSFIPFGV
jgi:phage baseplate assembly protein W